MAEPNRPARLNRSLLVLAGLLLLAGAAFILTTAFNVLGVVDGHATLLPARLAVPGWTPWVGAVVAVVVGLGCLRWLLAQTLRRSRAGTWTLTTDPSHGSTRMSSAAATAPLTAEIGTYPGVHAASARLAGGRSRPVLHLVVATEDRADISALRDRIDTEALPRLRQALDIEQLPVELLLRLNHARAPRVRHAVRGAD